MEALGLIVIVFVILGKVLFNKPMNVKHYRHDDEDLY